MYRIKTLQSTQTPKQPKHRLTFSFATISAANQSTVYSKVTLRRAGTVADTTRRNMAAQPFSRMMFTPVTLPLQFRHAPSAQPFKMCCLWFVSCRVPLWLPCKFGQNATEIRSGGRQGPTVTFRPFLLLLAKLYYAYMSVNGQIYCQIPCRLDDTVGNGAKISSLIETNPYNWPWG